MNRVHPDLTDKKIIWHYTKVGAALGIIEGRALHAASISLLNDSGELRHGMSVIAAYWEREDASDRASRIVKAWFNKAKNEIQESRIQNSYVVSASESGELQPLFLLYGSYAIGFNPANELTKELVDINGEYVLGANFEFGWRKVIYSDRGKNEVSARLFEELLTLARGEIHTEPVENCETCSFAQDCIFQVAVYFKEKSSAHEREVRLYGRAKETGAKVKFRTSTYGVVPYLEVKPRRLYPDDAEKEFNFPIRKINLGPGLIAPESAKVGLQVALDTNSYHYLDKPIEVKILSTTRRPS